MKLYLVIGLCTVAVLQASAAKVNPSLLYPCMINAHVHTSYLFILFYPISRKYSSAGKFAIFATLGS